MKLKSMVIIVVILLAVFLTAASGEDLSVYTFTATPIQEALKVIGDRYKVVIIADPALEGEVSCTIPGDCTVDEALKTIVEPLGYSYTKVEDYYLVSSPKSPVTIFAQAESCLVPVGFLDATVREKLGDLSQYLTYDEKLGVAYVTAPTSMLNKILIRLWKLSATSSQLAVVYHLQIVDLGTSTDLDSLFKLAYNSGNTDPKSTIVTADEISVDSMAQIIIRDKVAQSSFGVARQPWLITLPGKTVQLTSSVHHVGDTLDLLDKVFTVKITPIIVEENGVVISQVYVGNEKLGPISRLTSSIRSSPGSHELIAVVRQTKLRPKFSIWGKRQKKEQRDFAILLAATPVNVQNTLATASGIIPIASTGEIDRISTSDPEEVKPKAVLEIGGAVTAGNNYQGWVNGTIPLGTQGKIKLDYRNADLNSLGVSWAFESYGGTYMELMGGRGIGPENQNAILLGLGDEVQLNSYFSVFGIYYGAYLLDTSVYSNQSVWQAGGRLEAGKFGLAATAFYNPDFDGWRLKMDVAAKKHTWLLEYSTIEANPTLYLGIGFNF